jgi:lipoprotein-anchoring transpeptidase ErfK/SrfK
MKYANSLEIRLVRLLFLALFLITGGVLAAESISGQNRLQQSSDPELLEAERRLADLGYWILKIDGVRDVSTYHAIIAFQKAEKYPRTGKLTPKLLSAIRTAQRQPSRFSGTAHIEVDISRQILLIVDGGGIVTRILPVSTGSEEKYFSEGKWEIAHTPRGHFAITRKIDGVRHAPLGSLYYPNYFSSGVAIHGSPIVPPAPASHGCVRIPNFAAADFSRLVTVGMNVYVFD